LQGLKTLKVAFHHATKDEVLIHTIRLPKQSTVGDVITDLKTKVIVFPKKPLDGAHEIHKFRLCHEECGTLMSSNSSGSVELWENLHETLLQAYSYHKCDVSALAASPSDSMVYSAGCDGQALQGMKVLLTHLKSGLHWLHKVKQARGRKKPLEFSYNKLAHINVPMLLWQICFLPGLCIQSGLSTVVFSLWKRRLYCLLVGSYIRIASSYM
nr:WD40/YVTN repeat-like-containing domain-containing protein [Tanacetum cinerariifolium]